MQKQSYLIRLFFAVCCGTVGAGFAEATLGGIIRASEGADWAGFVPSIAFVFSAIAGVFLLKALVKNRTIAVLYAFLAFLAAAWGKFVLLPEGGIVSTSEVALGFSSIAFIVLTLGFIVGKYPRNLPQDSDP